MQPPAQQSHSIIPWYDSPWLQAYLQARSIIQKHQPGVLDEFESAMHVLQVPGDFNVQRLGRLLEPAQLARVQEIIAQWPEQDLEHHELFQFGRLVLHDHPEFTTLQQSLTDTVSKMVGETVVPSYNFLSLYNNLGVCPLHMDAPLAKWTLDVCIEQSRPWPIHISDIVPWPQHIPANDEDWHTRVMNDPDVGFRSYTLEENDAILFGGGNQWHYRDRVARGHSQSFCHLLFFHFVPRGCEGLLDPHCWHSLFGVPALANIDYEPD